MADRNKIIYLWDDPPFRKIFDPELNPEINPRVIKCTDNETQINYKTSNGTISSTTPYYLTRRKGFSHQNTKFNPEYDYCIDDPLFVEWYRPHAALNHDVNINILRTSDRETLLRYSENGEMFEITPFHIIRCLHVSASLKKTRNCRSDNFEMKDRLKCWLKNYSDLNSDIDPDKLEFSDCKTKLYYRPRGSDRIYSITPNGLFKKKDWYAPPQERNVYFAKDVPGFLEWFELYKDLNPDVDITSLTANSNISLYYRSNEKNIKSIKVYVLCARKDIFFQPRAPVHCSEDPNFMEWFEEYRWLNPNIDVSILTVNCATQLTYMINGKRKYITPYTLYRRKDILSQVKCSIRGDPLFWMYCIEEDRKTVDSYSKTNNKAIFKMRCPDGHEFVQSPERFYHYVNSGRDPCPYCDRRVGVIEGVNDAASIDPEIKIFYSDKNEKPLNKVSAYNGYENLLFKCPYCGYEFAKRMKNIIGKHPKCPKCKDKGPDVPQSKEYMPEGIPYLLVQDDPKSK